MMTGEKAASRHKMVRNGLRASWKWESEKQMSMSF
jgi:hypothetical protein